MKRLEATLQKINAWYVPERDLYRVSVVIFSIAGWNRSYLKPFQFAKGCFYIIRSGKTAVGMANRGFEWKGAVWASIYLVKGGITLAKFLPKQSKKGKNWFHYYKYVSKGKSVWKTTWKPSRLLLGVRGATWIWGDLHEDKRAETWVAYLGVAEVMYRRLKPFTPSITMITTWGR